MAIFSGKIIEAYYANPDNDTVEVKIVGVQEFLRLGDHLKNQ